MEESAGTRESGNPLLDTFDAILKLLGTAGLIVAGPILARARTGLKGTTLTSAWGWLVVGLTVWTAAWLAGTVTSRVDPSVADQLWYAAAVLMLCPSIAVLGARRPGARVWAWFVLLPLVVVLGWPALIAWDYARLQVSSLELELPAVIGFALVLVMGAGNYFGTRFTTASLLYAASILLVVAPFSPAVPDAFPESERARIWATVCLTAALAVAARQALRESTAPKSFDRLWIDVRDFFGTVWAKRLMDRVNDMAAREAWPLRLEMYGLVWTRDDLDAEARTATLARLDHTLRWLLRRFVDPGWIDERVGGVDGESL
jgi:hypothetical protein